MTNGVKVTYGAGNSITNTELVGFTIGQLRTSRQAQVLGIPNDANYYRGTSLVNDSYTMQSGDEIYAEARAASKAA